MNTRTLTVRDLYLDDVPAIVTVRTRGRYITGRIGAVIEGNNRVPGCRPELFLHETLSFDDEPTVIDLTKVDVIYRGRVGR